MVCDTHMQHNLYVFYRIYYVSIRCAPACMRFHFQRAFNQSPNKCRQNELRKSKLGERRQEHVNLYVSIRITRADTNTHAHRTCIDAHVYAW